MPPAAQGSLLEAQIEVLVSIARGQPLAETLPTLCRIVETRAGAHVRVGVQLGDGTNDRWFTAAGLEPANSSESAVVAELRCPAWSLPIGGSTGEVLGTCGIFTDEGRAPTNDERRLLQTLSSTAALAIERARADEAVRAGASRDRFLAELAIATQPLTSAVELMDTTARLLAEHLKVDRCAYAEVEDETTFVITGNYAPAVPSIIGRWPIAAFGPACVRDMNAGRAYVVTDTDAHPEIGPNDLPAYRATTIRAVICVPLHKHGRLIAAMAVHRIEPRRWTEHEIDLVRLVVARCWESLERARVTRTLQDSEARYRAMVEASPDCVMLLAADGAILQINEAGVSLIEGENERALLGTSIYDVIAREHRARFRNWSEGVARGERGTLDFELIGHRGSRRWVEMSTAAIHMADQRAQLTVTRDMTARVYAERALSESRARLDYAVQLSGVGFWYCDLPFDELIWDDRVKEHFFLPHDARVTIDVFYERIHAEDRELTRAAIDRSIRERSSYDVVYRTVCPTTREIKYVRALGGTAYDDAGQPRRFDGVTVDVTAARRDQERLARLLAYEQEIGRERARLLAQLREQERRKDEFLATLAHELRNPLAPIVLGLELLQRAGTPESVQRTHATMQRQLGHLVRIVDDLLDVSRVTLGKLDLQRERLDFHSVLASALETARPAIEASGQTLHVEVPPEPLWVDGDPTRLSQVLANLLSNATRYTHANGRIEVRVGSQGDHLEVAIRDDGIGIPPDMLEKIFDVFTQVSRSVKQARGGLGIGLTLVRRLVELHGGTITAASDGPGTGSTFTLLLPLGAAADLRAPSAVEPSARTHRALRVLVVDDNHDAAECLAALLESEGHQTILAHSGPDALEAALSHGPDVVLLDLGLPGFDGYEVARRLRALLGPSTPRLIAVSGFGGTADRERTRELGFERHLVKPVLAPVLATALSALESR